MLDLRYHVASLTAVFLALILGIVVGVGISGRGFVDKSERRNFESRIERLQARVDDLTAQNDGLRAQGVAAQTFIADAYPALMHGRLRGKRIALIVLGGGGGSTRGHVTTTLDDAGATLARYRAVKEPLARNAVTTALRHVKGFRRLPDIGRELGQEWVTGGKTPVADALAATLVEEERGGGAAPVDGVVVVQSTEPDDAATKRFLDGLYEGLASAGVPAVAVEQSGATPSTVATFSVAGGFSTVDDVETAPGRLALALLLGGAQMGDYGVKASAADPLPEIVPVPAG